jgi:hypothetical protein
MCIWKIVPDSGSHQSIKPIWLLVRAWPQPSWLLFWLLALWSPVWQAQPFWLQPVPPASWPQVPF